jgi:hypothetical protein
MKDQRTFSKDCLGLPEEAQAVPAPTLRDAVINKPVMRWYGNIPPATEVGILKPPLTPELHAKYVTVGQAMLADFKNKWEDCQFGGQSTGTFTGDNLLLQLQRQYADLADQNCQLQRDVLARQETIDSLRAENESMKAKMSQTWGYVPQTLSGPEIQKQIESLYGQWREQRAISQPSETQPRSASEVLSKPIDHPVKLHLPDHFQMTVTGPCKTEG